MKKLPNNTALLREGLTEEDFKKIVAVAEYQGFDMGCQSELGIDDYSAEQIGVYMGANCFQNFYSDSLSNDFNLITLSEFLSYGEPEKPWHERDALPPVGEKCLVDNRTLIAHCYEECIIDFIGKHTVVYSSDSCDERVASIKNVRFKPLPPQKTERECFIEDIKQKMFTEGKAFSQDEIAGWLYDAGYHNGPKVKPLPSDWHELYLNDSDPNKLSISQWFMAKGYCIAEGE